MSDTSSSSDQEAPKNWEPWIQNWRFSNNSIFRIPSYLDSMWKDWCQHSPLLIKQKFVPEPFYFFRHPLTEDKKKPETDGETNSGDQTPKIQFAQSALLTELLASCDNSDGASKKLNDVSDKLRQSIAETTGGKDRGSEETPSLLDEIGERPGEWSEFCNKIQAKLGSLYLDEEINFELLKSLPSRSKPIEDEELAKLLHHLILAFCNIDFRGYLQQRLNEKHLSLQTGERDKVTGYCLQLWPQKDPKKLPKIEWIRKLYWDGASEEIELNSGDEDQPPPDDILGGEQSNTYRDFLLAMFTAVNGRSALRPWETQRLVAVPVYEWSTATDIASANQTRRHTGGALLGWVLNRFPEKAESNQFGWDTINAPAADSLDPDLMQHIKSLAFLTETFASKYIIGETEWALEREWKNEDSAMSYMEHYFYHSCPWLCSFDTSGIDPSELEKTEAKFFHPLNNGDLLVNLSRDASPNSVNAPGAPVIAVLTPTRLYCEPDQNVENKYFTFIAEHARYFYRDRSLPRQQEKKAAQLLGEAIGKLKSAHDYSKDIGSALLRLSDFKKDLDRSRDSVLLQAEQLAAMDGHGAAIGERITENTKSWAVPNLDWFTAVQFTNAHQQTESLGALFGGPPECIKLLENGKLRDINELVRMLVWLPIPFFERKDKHRKLLAYAPEKLNHPATWHGLFQYDMVPSTENSNLHDRLGLKWNTILGESITQAAFYDRFKIPILCDGEADARVLWGELPAEQLKRLDGLLPLLVFSLRFAYQCAWAKTLLDEPVKPFRINLAGQPLPGDGRLIAMTFPSPIPVTMSAPESIPYYGEWLRQIRHYSNKNTTYPWRAMLPIGLLSSENSITLHLVAGS